MPSQSYYNQGDEWMGTGGNKDPHSFMNKRPAVRRAAPGIYDAASNPLGHLPPERQIEALQNMKANQKEAQRKLHALQKGSPNLAKHLAARKPSALVGLANNLREQVRANDWLFMILASFAFLKDIFDIVFATVGSSTSLINLLPFIGQVITYATVAIGITVSFVYEILLLCFTGVVLALAGSSWKNRGMAKYFLGVGIVFISEAFPGISLLPLSVIEVIVLYGFVLFDRAYAVQAAEASGTSELNIPTSGSAADGYATAGQKLAA